MSEKKKTRGPRSIASKILRDLEDDEEGYFLVLYDFKESPRTNFYKNLHRIMAAQEDGERIQASVIECRKLKTARAILNLVKHFRAEGLLYRAEPLE